MFCPKCSQSQTSDEMRYCSRCGFPLETVAQLLANDGNLPATEIEIGCRKSVRSRMATESVILTVFSWTVAMICTFWFNASGIFEGIATIGAFTFFLLGFLGLFRFLYAFLFLKSDPAPSAATGKLRERVQSQLPSPRVNPLSDWPRRENTREIVPQPSITEHTTRLLDEN
jgi:hypothetical protein